jgi:hypothetical protein
MPLQVSTSPGDEASGDTLAVPPHAGRALRTIFIMLAVMLLPGAFALSTVDGVRPMVPLTGNPSPHGYTWSLLFFIVPTVVLIVWHHRKYSSKAERRSLWFSFLALFTLGCVLDIVFGTMFFTFDNVDATLGIRFPVVGGTVPIEEFGFYSFGFAAILLTYVWASREWLAAYTPATRAGPRPSLCSLIHFKWIVVWTYLALLVGGILFKRFWPSASQGGFPGYYAFLLTTGALPTLLFYDTIRDSVNWEAMNFTVMLLLPVSVVWEGVLGVPYSWWGYKPPQMLGLTIDALSGLPIEEIFLWIVVGYAGINVYEVFRQWYGLERVPPGTSIEPRSTS